LKETRSIITITLLQLEPNITMRCHPKRALKIMESMPLTLKSRPREWSTTTTEQSTNVDILASTPMDSFIFSSTLFFSFK
jgi:hypothetical protein